MVDGRRATPAAYNGRMVGGEGYLLDNRQDAAGVRLAALGRLFDPWTVAHFERLGVAAGWRCWEVGAGGSSLPAWLADRVGPAGRVVATDIDVSRLPADGARGYEVRRHDVSAEPAPGGRGGGAGGDGGGGFDLVHARLVLVHVTGREGALRSMVAALRPGGVLLVEDADPALQPLLCLEEYGAAQRLANSLRRGFRELLAGRGAELAYGRTLPRVLREAGLERVGADAFFPITSPDCAVLERATVAQVGDRLLAAGLATAAQLDEHLANLDAGLLDPATSPMISAWGFRPAPGAAAG